MSLSEFMPYGAPELLEGAAPRMARSTMLATGLVVVLTWSAGLVAMHHPQVIELAPCSPPGPWIQPPPDIFDDTSPREPRVRPTSPIDPNAIPKVVPDDRVVEPTPFEPGPFDPNANPRSDRTDAGVRPVNSTGDGPEIPPIDQWVYVEVQPVFVLAVDPVYPELPRLAGIEGTVIVRMLVGLNGHVERAVVYPPAQPTMFDEAALTAARTSVFTPALSNGHPVRVWVSRAYRFKLH